jgi:hypothetical protein
MLLEKQKTLQQTAKENEYLEMVRNDYRKYYNHIVKQKEDQINAMNYLKQYINEIMVNGKLTDTDLENAKMEQDELIQEMANIKSKMDEITQVQQEKVVDVDNYNDGGGYTEDSDIISNL